MWTLSNVKELNSEYICYLKSINADIIVNYPSLTHGLNYLNSINSNKLFVLIYVESSKKGFICYNSSISFDNREILKSNIEQIIHSHNIQQRIYLDKISTIPN